MRFPTSSSPVESNTTILRASWPRSTTTLLHLLRSWSNNNSLLRYATVMIGREIHPSSTLRRRDHSRFVCWKKLNCPYNSFAGAGVLKLTGDSTVVDGSVVVEYGEVVTVRIAVRAWTFSVGSVDDGGIKATGAWRRRVEERNQRWDWDPTLWGLSLLRFSYEDLEGKIYKASFS